MLVADQRYCLRCGERRGRPRIDFTAFWAPLSPTNPERDLRETHTRHTADRGAGWLAPGTRMPSRRLTAALAAIVLAAGIIAGAALGPTPPNSPADAATLAQHAIAAMVARAGEDSRASSPTDTSTNAAAAPDESEAAPVSTPVHKTKATPQTAPTTAAPESEPSPAPPSEDTPGSSSSKGSGEGEKTTPGTPIKLPPIKHVWLIALSGLNLDTALKHPTADPYLAKQLAPKGTLLSNYTLSAPSALGSAIALLAGQGVNLDTEQNCPSYVELQPPSVNATSGLTEGVGCVYPAAVKTLADELTAGGLTWKAYVQDMEEGAPSAAESPTGTSGTSSAGAPSTTNSTPNAATPGTSGTTSPTPNATAPTSTLGTSSDTTPTPSTGASASGGVTCRHPELGAGDPNHTPLADDPYLTFRNPFVYFDSLLTSGACASDDVDLSQLQGDLATPADTPSFSWIAPSACNDGSTSACAPGAAAGLEPADAFLKVVVGQILATADYREGGLIVIVPDSPPGAGASTGSPSSGSSSDSSTAPASATTPVGALLLSPFVHSGVRVSETFNDFSLLKSLTQLFGVLPLGHANDPGTVSFGATVYSTTEKAAQAASRPRRQLTPHAGG